MRTLLDEISKFYRITGSSPNADPESHINDLAQYTEFLLSPYHDLLPYIWIRANLWSHLMQRPNKIQPSDNLDIQWAAAYLPFVDYAVTDDACRRLLQDSGLAEMNVLYLKLELEFNARKCRGIDFISGRLTRLCFYAIITDNHSMLIGIIN